MTYRKLSFTKYPALAVLLFATLACTGCVTYFGFGGPYEGKVIDRDTRQPIEGAVVYGAWHKHSPCSRDAAATYFNSQEALSDKKGEFRINGVGLQVLSCLDEMKVTVFKAGYAQQSSTPWSGLKNPRYSQDVDWEAGKIVFKLQQITLEERRKRKVTLPDAPDNKRNLFRIERNRELMEIGIPSGTLPKE